MRPAFHSTRPGEVALACEMEGWHTVKLWPISRRTGGCMCKGRFGACAGPGKHPQEPWAAPVARDFDTSFGRSLAWGASGLALATGRDRSGILVFDGDGPDAFAGLAPLEAQLGPLPLDTVRVRSGRAGGGEHRWYRLAPDGPDPINSVKRLAPEVDVRGRQGLSILPPTRHRSGAHYQWVKGCAPDEVEIAPLPAAWLEFLPTQTAAGAAPRIARPSGSPEPRGAAGGALRPSGEARFRFGDGDGLGGFNGPAYANALRYWGAAGTNADAVPILAAIRSGIDKAPKAPGRDVSRYFTGGYLESQVEAARIYIKLQEEKREQEG